ncbi:hypothetical protein SLS56_011002 [Neofusicoccum ribis]|uniref:Uncharacterized protein n=1 Tax=Neofusicoccum ribis TaxID=45134 RepID=A0ABR3SCU7_9PEZI
MSEATLPIQTNAAPSADHSTISTPTPATTRASRNPTLVIPGSNNTLTGRRSPSPAAGTDYLTALAAAAQASLQSAPSSPGADLPIARSGKRNSIYGLQQHQLPPQRHQHHQHHQPEHLHQQDEADELVDGTGNDDDAAASVKPDESESSPGRFNSTSFLDIDSSTPVTTPGSAAADDDVFDDALGAGLDAAVDEAWADGDGGVTPAPLGGGDGGLLAAEEDGSMMAAVAGGPVVGRAEEVGDEEEQEVGNGYHNNYVDPLARARAGVSVAKGEGLVEQTRSMLEGSGEGEYERQRSWGEKDLRSEMSWNA